MSISTNDPNGRTLQLISVFVLGLAIWSYLPTLKFDFTLYDDDRILLQQSDLFANGDVEQRIKNIVINSYPREEPLVVRDLSWLLDSIAFGPTNPFGYHFSNVLYHSLVLFLLFWLLVRLTDFRIAAISLGVIALLAVHVEPVAWIMGRKDVLYAMFSLLSMHCYLRFRQQTRITSQILLYIATLVCAVAAFLSKISAIILPILLVLIATCESIDNDKIRFKKRDFIRLALETTPILLLALIVYIGYQSILERYGVLAQADILSISDYLKIMFLIDPLVLIEYLKMVFSPDKLSVYYNEPWLNTAFTWHHYATAFLVFAMAGLVSWHMWRTNRKALLLLACFFVSLLPYGNWKFFGFTHADRYLYFAVLFFIPSLISYLLPVFYHTKSWVIKLGLVATLILVVFNNYTYRQEYLYAWQDGESLWLKDISRPNPPLRSYNSLTRYYLTRARHADATDRIDWLKKAKANNQVIFNMPIEQRDQFRLAVTYVHEGSMNKDLHKQLQAYKQALEIVPTYSPALQGIALCYFKLAKNERTKNKRTQYAKQSLFYFRRHFESISTFSYARNQHLVILNQLKAEFPVLEIPELSPKI